MKTQKNQISEFMIIDKIIEAVAQRCSVKKGVPRSFAKFTGQHLCKSLFFNKVTGPVLQLY